MNDTYRKAMAKATQDYANAVSRAANMEPEPEDAPKDQPFEFNASAFFDEIRSELFGGRLDQGQVDGHNIIGDVCLRAGLNPILEQSAYILATVYHETARTMRPIEEFGGSSRRYSPWFGRGFVQLTWESNYKKQQEKLGEEQEVRDKQIPYKVHDDWDLALVPETSSLITVLGMRDGDFTGKKLGDYIKRGGVDYVNARRIVNGTDRAQQIAEYAQKYESALKTGKAG